ncbi:GNAT family N-acetyltransferase [Cytobacillus sp. FJAT-54145]|uniref:GNAT family N-acetyltransferase n=1 Tax=Cytobacillus spartinae TaxID=3299023 RepID=A0ABW6KB39_9BACI
MSIISIRDLTTENFYKCINLRLSEEQEKQIVSNVYSIAESKVNPCYTPYIIYLGEEVIGFVMTDYDPSLDDENKYWVPRLMIDSRFQGKGYGKEAMKIIIDRLRLKEDCKYIRLSTEPTNHQALKFYESIGFKNTGKLLEESEYILEYRVDQ